MPNVERAIQMLNAWEATVEQKHDNLTRTTRALNLVTFGLAASAAVAPIYNAYKDLTTALAIGAGVSYTSNTLFFPGDQASLYNAAQDSFTCVSNKGQRLLSAISPDKSLKAFEDNFAIILASVSACRLEPGFQQLQIAFTAARDSLARALEADYGAGKQLQEAGRNIAIAVNRELDNRAASSAAIFAAARSVSAFSVPASSAASAKPAQAAAVAAAAAAAAAAPGAACTDADRSHLATQTAAYADKKKNIDKALDAIGQLDSACNFNSPAVPDLAVSQDSVTLTPSAFVNIVVNGGRAPYVVIWEGTDPSSNGIDANSLSPNTVRVSASSKLTAAANYTLAIRDSSVSGQTRKIAVVAKPAP